MNSGHLYILSNVFLGPELLKVGFTTRDPKTRAAALSRSTAIPGPFNIEFSSPVRDGRLAERRLHLLLRKKRVNKDKEFFRLSVSEATSLCESIRRFEQEELAASPHLLMHRDFRFTEIRPYQTLPILQALMHILSATQHNSYIDHLLEERLLIVDGFTSAAALARFRGVGVNAAAAALRRIAGVATELQCSVHQVAEPISLFSEFVYEKGHAAWTFQSAFRRLFIIPNM